jgi:hypothetical protein
MRQVRQLYRDGYANDLVIVTRWMEDSKNGEFMKLVNQSFTK